MSAEKGAQLIVKDILKEAEEKSAEIIEAAKKEARTVLDAARSSGREEGEKEVEGARAQARSIYEEILAAGRMRAKKEVLQRREELIDEVFKEAERKLRAHASLEKYEEDIVRIATGACEKLGSDSLVIYANERDLRLLEKHGDRIARGAARGGRSVSISFGEPIQTIGGVRVGTADRKMEIDDTFEGRMRREFEALRVKVARVLFEGSG